MENIWKEFKNLISQVKKIGNMNKAPKNSLDYKAFIYSEDARIRANLKRIVPTMILSLICSIYILISKICNPKSPSDSVLLYTCVLITVIVLEAIYTAFIADIMNKSKMNMKKGKWIYMSFWVIFEISVALIAIFQYLVKDHIEPWFIFIALVLVAPVFNRKETIFILIYSEVLIICTVATIGFPILKYALLAIPFILMGGIFFQSTYFGRMKVILTQSKIEQKGYILEKRMEGILEDLFDEVYEINLNKKDFTLVRSKGTFKSSHIKESYEKSLQYIINNLVYPMDAELYAKKFSLDNIKNEFREGKKQIYHEARRLKSDGSYAWTSTLMIREYTENEDEFRFMLLLQDIDNRKTSEVKLKTAAQMDPLTKLYNKTTTKALIEEYISSQGANGSHAFIIIDLDEFKSINDTHGHFTGDDVLVQLAKELKSYFRESDILGRIGGDEFVAFIKNVQSVALVCDKVQKLSSSFKKYGIDNNFNHKLSTSMGIAMFNKDGKTYNELYQSADKALYEAKRNGKDQYKFSIRNQN